METVPIRESTVRPGLRAVLSLFGLGLLALFIVGMTDGATRWFAWLDLIGSTLALSTAFSMPNLQSDVIYASCMLYSLGVVALWIVGLTLGATAWLAWISFGLAAMLFLGTLTLGPLETERPRAPIARPTEPVTPM